MNSAAWAVVVAALVGGLIGQVGIVVNEWIKDLRSRRLDAPRKEMLKIMLQDSRFDWRHLSTLSRVIGADEETTKRLLIEIGARGSQNKSEEWGLISKHPIARDEQE